MASRVDAVDKAVHRLAPRREKTPSVGASISLRVASVRRDQSFAIESLSELVVVPPPGALIPKDLPRCLHFHEGDMADEGAPRIGPFSTETLIGMEQSRKIEISRSYLQGVGGLRHAENPVVIRKRSTRASPMLAEEPLWRMHCGG